MAAPADRPGQLPAGDCFLSCDWGTSTFRLRLASRTSGQLAVPAFSSDQGVRAFHAGPGVPVSAQCEDCLVKAMSAMRAPPVPVVISGMAASSIGWREVPYARVPHAVTDPDAVSYAALHITYRGVQVPVYLLSGVCSESDVMRGEEAELAGIFTLQQVSRRAEHRYRVILPGTHSKHALIERRGDTLQMTGFTTFMTGEVFELLARESILRNSVDWGSLAEAAHAHGGSFDDGVRAAIDRGMARSLFQVRARGLLHGNSRADNLAFLLGTMLGEELKALAEDAGDALVILAATGSFASAYQRAMATGGLVPADRLLCIPPGDAAAATVRAHAQWLRHHAAASSQG